MSPSGLLHHRCAPEFPIMRFVPTRQGVHFPQLSSWVNSIKNRAISTMQVSSSMTIMPPEPIMEPALCQRFIINREIQIRMPANSHPSVRRFELALNALSFLNTHANIINNFTYGYPIGTSIKPVLLISPASAKVFVPLLFSVPMAANQFAPFKIIWGTLAYVSTLLMLVGLSHKPSNGGEWRARTRFSPFAFNRTH